MKLVLSHPSHYLDFFVVSAFKNDDDFLVILILMGMLFFVFAVILTVILIVIFFGILLALVGAGIISASVLVGMQQRSLNKGLKTLLLMASVLGSTIVSVIFFWFGNQVRDWWSQEIALFIGIGAGLVLGCVLGLLFFNTFLKIKDALMLQYHKRQRSQRPSADYNYDDEEDY